MKLRLLLLTSTLLLISTVSLAKDRHPSQTSNQVPNQHWVCTIDAGKTDALVKQKIEKRKKLLGAKKISGLNPTELNDLIAINASGTSKFDFIFENGTLTGSSSLIDVNRKIVIEEESEDEDITIPTVRINRAGVIRVGINSDGVDHYHWKFQLNGKTAVATMNGTVEFDCDQLRQKFAIYNCKIH